MNFRIILINNLIKFHIKSSSKKSLHIIYALKSGGGENVLKLFCKQGDSCISLTKNTNLERDQYIKLPFRISGKDSYYRFRDYFQSIPSLTILLLYLIIKKRKLSIVFHGFPFQFIAPIFSCIQKNNVYFVYHQFKKFPKTQIGSLSVAVEKFFLRFSDSLKIVGVSPWVNNSLKVNFQLKRKIKMLTVPVNIDEIKSDFEIEYNGFRETNYLIYGARLVKEKGHMRLLEDLQKMHINKPKINTIVFCGSGPLYEEINFFAKTKLTNYQIFILQNLDKNKYLNLVRKSSGFLFPSFREAFPLSLLESIFICKNVFIWEKYLYDFYSECSYEKNNLNNFLLNGYLNHLPNRKNVIDKLKLTYLKSDYFLNMIS